MKLEILALRSPFDRTLLGSRRCRILWLLFTSDNWAQREGQCHVVVGNRDSCPGPQVGYNVHKGLDYWCRTALRMLGAPGQRCHIVAVVSVARLLFWAEFMLFGLVEKTIG